MRNGEFSAVNRTAAGDDAETSFVSVRGPMHLVPHAEEGIDTPAPQHPIRADFVIKECVNGFEGYTLPPKVQEIGEQ